MAQVPALSVKFELDQASMDRVHAAIENAKEHLVKLKQSMVLVEEALADLEILATREVTSGVRGVEGQEEG